MDEALEFDRGAIVTVVEGGFIRLSVFPRLPNAECDLLLLLLHIVSAQFTHLVVHVLNSLVVHMREQMDKWTPGRGGRAVTAQTLWLAATSMLNHSLL